MTLHALLATLVFAPFASALSLLSSRAEPNSSHSAFVYNTAYGNITFAVTAVKDVGDLYFHLEAPAQNSWVAVGTGGGMKGSLMFVVYRSLDEKGVTLSPRTTNANVEPSYDDRLPCDLVTSDGVTNGIVFVNDQDRYIVNGHCKGINQQFFMGGELDFSNHNQSFIFAFGPTDRHLHSDTKDASIRRHTLYGHFQMDLSQASVDNTDGVSNTELSVIGDWENRNAQLTNGPSKDRDWGGPIHSVMMCGTFVIIFPIGVVFLRLLDKVIWHGWTQSIGAAIICIGAGLGVWASKQYNHSKNFRNPHQLVGLAAIGLVLIQLTFGLIHHILWLKRQRPTILGRIHLYLGPFVVVLGAANGFLGFTFSGGSYHNIMYGIICAVVFVALAIALFWAQRRKKKQGKRGRTMAGSMGAEDMQREFRREEAYEGYKQRDSILGDDVVNIVSERQKRESKRLDVELREIPMDDAPAYDNGARPVRPRSMV
ncbi:hypothetical protein BDV96DRAFT_603605 [Lophiotrema nucula]|uniref:Cytochrome b561 domain-containing protein n=1 Tax=Lophiotrema nucula TaxID=690887 RepID=A0A6A5YVL4_9PLEO|nr:hypothetical protein BDV96DRAFT_603605 [Lophiotrema nucula]